MKYRAICENHLYGKAYAKGRRAVTSTVSVYVLPDFKADKLRLAHPLRLRVNRIGLTVSKKLGNAVKRNRVKRILREGYRLIDRETPIKTGHLIVIAARTKAVTSTTEEVKKDLAHALSKLRLI